ncbi:MAG: hypothetical protein QOE27_1540 [Solirubrobacteraceae bacterium]|jgi:hypothetical protein|nr:hypothetical protein [Solirubrobacteraceae bacterium]
MFVARRQPVSIADCRLIEFPITSDPRGNLTVIEGAQHIPFEIARIFYLDVVPAGATRAGHANRRSDQVLVALAGSFEVTVDDGDLRASTTLNRSSHGYFLPHMIWRELAHFSSGAICLALASEPFDENDYHRDYEEYVRAVTGR